MVTRRIAARLLAPIAGASLLAGCATVPGGYRLAERDPLEKFNRGVWNVNMAADKAVIKPVTQAYRAVAPRPVRQGVSNLFANLTEPWSFINNMLQGKPKRAAQNLERFLINSTIGIGGLWDRASKMGVQPANEDLGQTLAVWGVNGGPYLVLPLLGPSSLRDGIGTGVAAYADPVRVAVSDADIDVWYKRGYLAAQIVSIRSDLMESGGDAFLQSSLDPYAAARSAYLQSRGSQIANLDGGSGTDLPGGPEQAVPTPAPEGGVEAAPAPGAPLPDSAAPLPGDASPPAQPQSSPAPLPESAAPLPGDDAPAPAGTPQQ